MSVVVFTAVGVCQGSTCLWGTFGDSVSIDVPWGASRTLTVYCCTFDGLRCNAGAYDRTCMLPGTGTVPCRCNQTTGTIVANVCPSEESYACE